MLRVPCARLIAVAVGLAAAALPAAAWSQDATTEQRLDRLERDLNMLQRQVYRGAPAPAQGSGDSAVSIEIRMDRLEAQMRNLTGRVEEVVNQIAQGRRGGAPIDNNAAARPGPGGVPAVASAGSPPPPPAAEAGGALPFPRPPGDSDAQLSPLPPAAGPGSTDAPGIPPGTLVPPPAGPTAEAAPDYGTLAPPGTRRPELAGAAAASRPAAPGTLPSGSTTDQYNRAFGLLRRADYPAAEAALKAFVAQHPSDPMAGNAQYWLGETYYARHRYMEAAGAFAEGYKRYPRGTKAADGLLKLGMALSRADQKANACVAFAKLDHDFPHPGAALKEHAATEKKRLGC